MSESVVLIIIYIYLENRRNAWYRYIFSYIYILYALIHDAGQSLRNKCTILTLKPKLGVQLRGSLHANNARGGHTLRVKLDILRAEILAGGVGIALEHDSLGMFQVRQTDVVPAGIGDARPITGVVGIDGAGEIRPGEVLHHDGRGGVDGARPRAGRPLVPVALGDEDGEGDVEDADVLPDDVLDEPLAAGPGLEAGGVQGVDDGDVLEAEVGDVGEVGGVFA